MADVKSDEVSLKPGKRKEYQAPTLRTFGNIEVLTLGAQGGGKMDNGKDGKGSKTGGLL